jgi:hypothetical protein
MLIAQPENLGSRPPAPVGDDEHDDSRFYLVLPAIEDLLSLDRPSELFGDFALHAGSRIFS